VRRLCTIEAGIAGPQHAVGADQVVGRAQMAPRTFVRTLTRCVGCARQNVGRRRRATPLPHPSIVGVSTGKKPQQDGPARLSALLPESSLRGGRLVS